MVRSINQSRASSESESDGESTEKLSTEEENDSEYDFNADNKASSSTRVAGDNIKLQLVKALGKVPQIKLSHTKAIKTIKWDDLDLDEEYTPDELKTVLAEIVKQTGSVRTLGEILQHYKMNSKKYEFDSHPDRPVKPLLPQHLYMHENKEKLTQKFEKDNPGMSKFTFISYCFIKFKGLPEVKQEVYKKRSEILREKYQQQMKEFYSLHPEFNPAARKAKAAGRRPGVHSPYNAYRETLTNGESHHVAQKMWKNLHPEEKVKFIKLVANMDTAEKKLISKDEWKILEQEGFNGMPKKPNNAYQLFVADYAKTYTGERKRMIEISAVAWKNLGDVKKKIYDEKHEDAIEKFRIQLKKYIKGLPKDKQPLMMQKFKKELGEERKRKNSNNETVLNDSKSEPPKKKKKKDREEKPMKIKQSPSTNDEEEVLAEVPKKKKKDDDSPRKKKDDDSPRKKKEDDSPKKKKDDESPQKKKIKKNGESSQESFKKDISSPKKKPVLSSDESEEEVFGSKKKSKSMALEFPSQTTAHYFMTRIYKGNRKNITEAYKSLSKSMKAKYFSEMKRQKQKFLETVAEYIKTASPGEVVDVKLKSKNTKQQQLKELGWHKEKGTDDESRARPSSDSSSDSDSS